MQSESGSPKFPFKITDLIGVVLKLSDGTTVRHELVGKSFSKPDLKGTVKELKPGYGNNYVPGSHYGASLSDYCSHTPKPEKTLFKSGNLSLYVADANGARNSTDPKNWDFLIDCGEVLTPPSLWYPTILRTGSAGEFDDLDQYEMQPVVAPFVKYLKIKWTDRAAPFLEPAFWPALAKKIQSDAAASPHEYRTITACQGGHGRSGTSAVCLMMCMTDYDALDAITHLRAVHCSRAIESVVQHDYINKVAAHLGRETNAHLAEKVKSFKERFLTMTSKFSAVAQAQLEGK